MFSQANFDRRMPQVASTATWSRRLKASTNHRPLAPLWLTGLGNCSVFFSQHAQAALSKRDTHAVELTHADREAKALLYGLLYHRTGDGRGRLAHLDEKGSHETTQLDGVTMPLVSGDRLSFSSYPLEEPTDSRTLHGNFTLAAFLAAPRLPVQSARSFDAWLLVAALRKSVVVSQ